MKKKILLSGIVVSVIIALIIIFIIQHNKIIFEKTDINSFFENQETICTPLFEHKTTN